MADCLWFINIETATDKVYNSNLIIDVLYLNRWLIVNYMMDIGSHGFAPSTFHDYT